jgi:hypothetical protein
MTKASGDVMPHDMEHMGTDTSAAPGAMPAMEGRHATADAMDLNRTRTASEWIGICLIVLLALGVGAGLVSQSRGVATAR